MFTFHRREAELICLNIVHETLHSLLRSVGCVHFKIVQDCVVTWISERRCVQTNGIWTNHDMTSDGGKEALLPQNEEGERGK